MFKSKTKFFARAVYFAGGPEKSDTAPKAPEKGKDGSDLSTPDARKALYDKAEDMAKDLRAKEAQQVKDTNKPAPVLAAKAGGLERAVKMAKVEEADALAGAPDSGAKVAAARVSERIDWILHPKESKGKPMGAAESERLAADLTKKTEKIAAEIAAIKPTVMPGKNEKEAEKLYADAKALTVPTLEPKSGLDTKFDDKSAPVSVVPKAKPPIDPTFT